MKSLRTEFECKDSVMSIFVLQALSAMSGPSEMLDRNILRNDTLEKMFYEHSQFLLFAVVPFFKVSTNAE